MIVPETAAMAVMPGGATKIEIPRWIQLVGLPLLLLLIWVVAGAARHVVFLFLVAALVALLLNPLVRGLGMMLAIELVRDRETKEPAPELATAVAEALSAAVGAGLGERDFTDLVELIERQAGVTLWIAPRAPA